jgi:EAL domain-containing protein (putative c-di-GMP-specific phosphodiesterase class I)
VQGPLHAASVCQAIQREGMAPFRFNDHEVFTTISVGVVCNDPPAREADDMLRDAGVAQHEGSRRGPGRFTIYEPRMHEAAVATFQLEMDLRRALDRREFCLHYQPIVDLDTGQLQGFEALLRWNHPSQGLVPPDRFIPLAEETGMIVPMERWVLREGCRTIRGWRNLLPPTHPLSLHVNISSKHLIRPDLASELERTLAEFNLDPQWLRIELTETAIAENPEIAIGLLHELRSLGCLLSVDDFGTGYSSLACLQRYPIDLLKIDRAFIASLTENATSEELVRLILVLSDHFGLDAIAEGIETEEQLRVLRELGCRSGQGFLFSRAVDADRAQEFVRQSALGIGLLPDRRSAAA